MEAFDHAHYVPTFPFSYPFITTTSTTTTNSPWMDTRIWSRLPQRLIDRVIAFLPPPAFFRARSVCKRWYSLLFSHTFLQMYLQINPKPYFFIFFKQKTTNPKTTTTNTTSTVFKHGNTPAATVPEEGYIFDPETLSWHRLVFPLIPSGFSPTCSSGGLVCWVSDEAGSKGLLLSNPLFPSLVTPLPSTLRPRLFPSVGLTITNSSIDVMVAGDDMISPYAVKNLTTESFHIDLGGFYSIWGTTSSLPRLCSLESGKMVHVHNQSGSGSGSSSSGKFYCMNYSPFSVLSYDMGRNEWSKIQAPMRRFLRSPSLVESRGRLVLIAAVEKSKLNVPRSLRMWALQSCGTTWVEIERMPQQLYAQFAELEGGRGFTCVGNGEFVVVMITGTAAEKAVLFDFVRKRWVWVPRCPYVGGGELNGFAYVPRLATPVTGLLDQLTNLNPF
ncbi:putative F-box domain, galactose oxidase/kelch, beta-propeller, kelch-type beta propeller [Helianthus annuus]|nr:putative F-box domain, galactose oxidase/kelch, beta-propeller, kelch-type beta propeller [Helianthus annuus]